ncbi:MAG TPA: hypothetical protein VJ385_17800 [Fibrobacteria bacterium]|nr:hypothetical protein [Fibrobacteria bacterium]
MADGSKDMSVSLLQPNLRRASARNKPNWPLRAGIALLLIAGDALLVGNKDKLLSKTGFASVRALPMPSASLSADDQALYWTYALYDSPKFRARFHVEAGYTLSRGHARHELESLLPEISPATLAEISGYGAVAFRAANTAAISKPGR